MACIAEAMGLTVPGGASPPAVTAARMRVAESTGTQAVWLAKQRMNIGQILTDKSLENGMRVLLAIGGSTNAIVHLAAIAGRIGYEINLEALDRMSQQTPVLLDLKPSGEHYMEDFHAAGGMATLLRELKPLLHLDALTVTGRTLGEEIERSGPGFNQQVVKTRSNPIYPQGGIAVLRGNLAPEGAIIKQSAAHPQLMEHEGRAVVFENLQHMAELIDSEDLDVHPEDVLVLKNIGPKGAPGMPEAGYMPIPRKLAKLGVKDMVRISDGRMSGTAFGTIILHVTPEAALGGPLAYVQNGDRIKISVSRRTLELGISDQELSKRMQARPVTAPQAERGYRKLYLQSVTQADQGADFDFLQKPGPKTPLPRC
jgi:dihydroxy-acid dehydratase